MVFGHKSRVFSAAEKRRRAILDAVLRVIARGGPDATTHRRVAAEAKVPLGSLTYYFESRDDLIREAFRYYMVEVDAFVREVSEQIPAATVAQAVERILEHVRREFADPAMLQAEYELILYATRDKALARDFNAWESTMEARLAPSLENLGAKRPVDAARTIINLVRGFELEGLTRPHVDTEDLKRRLLPVVRALTGARSAPAPRRGAVQLASKPVSANSAPPTSRRRRSAGDHGPASPG